MLGEREKHGQHGSIWPTVNNAYFPSTPVRSPGFNPRLDAA